MKELLIIKLALELANQEGVKLGEWKTWQKLKV